MLKCLDFAGFSHIPCIQSGVLTFRRMDMIVLSLQILRPLGVGMFESVSARAI